MTRGGRCSGDDGYATVAAAGIVAAVVSLFILVAGVGAHVVDSHRAQVAADLAAVAGAQARYRGVDACATARATASANSAHLGECSVADRDVVVRASVRTASAAARAGPL